MNITSLTACRLRDLLCSGELTSEQVVTAFLDRIASVESQVDAFLQVHSDQALHKARQVDRRRARGEPIGPLAGLPVAVKDNICCQDEPTSCASRMLEHFRPPYRATVVERLEQADGIVLGKTNLDEFAMGSSTENSAVKPTRNPWDTTRVPGGSSGGAAASIAAQMAPLSLGSDTGGSIRQPAAFCGVVGLKPTYGRVSRYGLVAFASSLDQIGPLAATAQDAALLLEAIAGHDPRDSTSAAEAVPGYTQTIDRPLKGLRIGVPREHFEQGLDPQISRQVQGAIDQFRQAGATIHDVSLPHSRFVIAAYYVIAPSEASSNLARYDGVHYGYRTDERQMLAELEQQRRLSQEAEEEASPVQLDTPLVRLYRKTRAEGFGDEVKRRIMLGTYALSSGYYDAYYLKALKVRRLIRQDFDRAFEQVDLLAGPTTPSVAFPLGAMVDDPLALYLQDLFTVGANLAGIPSISLPCGFSDEGLPVGLQLQAPHFAEQRLLQAAAMYQSHTAWHQQRPPLGANSATEGTP